MKEDRRHSNNDLGLSMIDTLRASELPNIAKEITETSLDAILDDGILKNLPVIGMIAGGTKLYIAIKDKLLIRKIYSFLAELSDISYQEREQFINKLEDDPKYQRKVGENLIMLLDRLDDLDKPPMVAKLLKAHIHGDINYQQLVRFESIIDRMAITDLQNLLDAFSTQKPSPEIFAEHLYPTGLSNVFFDDTMYVKAGSGTKEIRQNNLAKYIAPKNPLQFSLSSTAYLLAQILLGAKVGNEDYIAKNRQALEKENKGVKVNDQKI